MTELLTCQERSDWALTLAYPPSENETQLEFDMGQAIIRYENSLQAKDAQIAALQAQLEAESDIQYAQRTQIERLTRGLREIMEISNAMGDPFRRAKVIAWKAIKEATP